MKRTVINLLLIIFIFLSCSKKEDIEDPCGNIDSEKIERTVLIYAVNRSSLSYDFTEDLKEILSASSEIDLKKYQILIYKTDSEKNCGLYKVYLNKSSNSPALELVRDYKRDITSTHPQRIKEIIDYSLTLFPTSKYDLIFWGHGMSWKPYYSDHVVDSPQQYAYGGEYSGGTTAEGYRETDWVEINELAQCVPDNQFETIWFDCCYMTGIEVLYEFRNKCNIFVGYPSEVWSYGLAYDLILPRMLRSSPDIKGAAEDFFNYYNRDNEPVTVAVLDMSAIEDVAEISKKIIHSGELRPDPEGLLNYSRTKGSPFYDFRQFFKETADLNGAENLIDEFNKKLDTFTLYHAESDRNFSLRPWDTKNISGISTHFYQNGLGADESFYETLDWFKRVY